MNRPKGKSLASRMRAEMSGRKKPFRSVEIARALGLAPGPEREKATKAMQDFLARGEVRRVGPGLYVCQGVGIKRPAPMKRKVLKAMYVTGRWTTGEILKLVAPEIKISKDYIQRITAALRSAGLVEVLGTQKRPAAYGIESIYRITDRDRFRREVME